ncbi:MAG: hypothetical protein OS130_13600 [Thermodesulfobacteriota bacterium]|nr:MAG: hypothetical protein OS130_13600 [Thermodesulfobacteriota bacterium]
MNKKLRHLIVALVLGTVFSFFIVGMKSTRSEETKKETAKEVPLLLSIADKFTRAKRPPVQFFHDTHAHALKQEGCQACHPSDEKGITSYSFPKKKMKKTKGRLPILTTPHVSAVIKNLPKARLPAKRVMCQQIQPQVRPSDPKVLSIPIFTTSILNLHRKIA